MACSAEAACNEGEGHDEGYDKVTQASLNSLYVKAQELDRGHNEKAAPAMRPPGMAADAEAHASTHASDAETHASVAAVHAVDGKVASSNAEAHASSHACDGAAPAQVQGLEPQAADEQAHASDAETHASDAETHASDAETHASTHASDA